jgi:hypothetical protein
MASPLSWYVRGKVEREVKFGRTKEVGSRTVGVGDTARAELRGEPGGVDKGDKVGELLDEDMLS